MRNIFKIFSMLFIFLLTPAMCYANDAPPGSTNSVKISIDVAKHYFDYMHWHPIGACFWLHVSFPYPYITATPELDEYLPDLVVTVFNEQGDDPWTEARIALDKVSHFTGNAAMHFTTGDELTDGRNTSTPHEQNNNADITKTVDIVGSPADLLHIPYLMLKPDTTPFIPYFQSDLDSVPARMGIAEAIRLASYNPYGHYIGSSFINHWAYEFPRSMSVDNNNDYKASVSIALHAADIVTNKNTLHVVHSTHNTCGKNCAVANVIEEQSEKNEIWQEVYPIDRHVVLGQSDTGSVAPLGQADYEAGHGNYVFVIWRHYRGCIQSQGGHYLFTTVHVSPTIKR